MHINAPETEQLSPGLRALLTTAAFAPINNVGWLRVSGSDRVRWLNGMVTNNIAALAPGEGCYTFFLNAQGRIQGDATAWMLEDSILLETAADRISALITMLDHFIIMDDVELTLIADRAGLTIAGPASFDVFRNYKFPSLAAEPLHLSENQNLQLISDFAPRVPTFRLWSDSATIKALELELALTVLPATLTDIEQLRILSGTPLYGTDIRDKDLPQETAQTRALHFSKGCYLGQEIVERIRSRGNVHRTFSGFILHGDLPPAGIVLYEVASSFAEGAEPASASKPVGELTSITTVGSLHLALGYIRREALDRNATLTYPGGTASPSSLPFPIPETRS